MKLLFARWYTSVTLAFITLLLQACEPTKAPTGLVYCSEGNPESFNPQQASSSTSIDATSHQIYNRLISYDPKTGAIIPELATHWQISDDGLKYHFYLRSGVTFHQSTHFTPSRNFTADDVIFSFSRVIDPNHPYFNVSKMGYPYFESIGLAKVIDYIEKTNDDQVVFYLKQRDASFLSNLATDFSVILSAEYGDKLLKDNTPEFIDHQAIGTGPYQLIKYVKNEYIRYHKNQNYWGAVPQIDKLVFDITPKSSSRLIKLITGDCSISALPKSGELAITEHRQELELESRPGLNVSFLALNTSKPPFDNPLIRQALSLAIDKQKILLTIFNDRATEASGLLPPASWAYNPDQLKAEYNPQQARSLLQQAGIKQLKMNISVMTVGRPYNPNPHKTAELIQSDLANIGVNANINSVGWSIFNTALNRNNYDSVIIGWNADNSDPDNFFTPLLSCMSISNDNNTNGNNLSRWCDPHFEKLITQAKQSTSKQQRIRLYHQAESYIAKQIPVIVLANNQRQILKRSEVNISKLAPFGGIAFANIKINSSRNDH